MKSTGFRTFDVAKQGVLLEALLDWKPPSPWQRRIAGEMVKQLQRVIEGRGVLDAPGLCGCGRETLRELCKSCAAVEGHRKRKARERVAEGSQA